MMKRNFALLTVILASVAFATDVVKMPDILKDADKYDKKVVKTTGKLKDFKARTSKAGNDYMTFDLVDGSSVLKGYAHGKMELKDGDKVEIEGKFVKEKVMFKGKPNEFTVKNEVDCSGKKDESPKIKLLK